MSLASQVGLLSTRVATECKNLWTAVNGKVSAASPTFTGTTTIDVLAVNGNGTIGNGDQDVLFRRSVEVESHQRNTTVTYSSGKVSTVVEKDGATTVRTTTFNYTGDVLNTVVEVGGGKTITTTMTYTGSDLTGTTRSVV